MRKTVVSGILMLVCMLACAKEAPRIEVGKIEGFTEVGPGTYLIGEDLRTMAQWYPSEQYSSPKFFEEVVTKKYEEKKREFGDAVLKVDRLFEELAIEGIEGVGFSLVGEMKGQEIVFEYYWFQVGSEAAKVMILGNAKTYDENKTKIHDYMRSLEVK